MLTLLALLSCHGDPTPQGDDTGPAGCGPAVLQVSEGQLSLSRQGCGALSLAGQVLGEGSLQLRLDVLDDGSTGAPARVQPVITGNGVWTGLSLAGAWSLDGAADPVLWRQGYESWSWSGVQALAPLSLDADGLPALGGDGDATSVIWEVSGTSWWGGLVGRPDGASLLLAAQSAALSRFAVAVEADQAWVIWGHRGERVAVDAEHELALDPLVLALGTDAQALQVDWATAVADRVPPRPLDPGPPTGWATWYQLYSGVTQDQVLADLAAAAEVNQDAALAPLEVFQVDDGWEQRWGDWTANDRFPDGMASLAAQISAAGMRPGLWMAPFYVSVDSPTFAAHADWWVRGSDDQPLTYTGPGGTYAVIDATHPQAGPWMAQQVADRVAEGWTWLKLDFLYAGAEEGQRYADVTGIQAYHLGMQQIRGAAPDAWILACGAPLLPTVGYVEQYRTGADIAFELFPDPDPAFLRWQARSTAARNFANGRWWWSDADQVLVRPPFTEAQARGAVVANAVSGGAWLLGDDLPGLDPARLALALEPEVVALRGTAAVPQAPLAFPSGPDASPLVERGNPDDQVPQRWIFPDGTIALLNLSEGSLDLDGPGGLELLTGRQAAAGPLSLAPGEGQLWQPTP